MCHQHRSWCAQGGDRSFADFAIRASGLTTGTAQISCSFLPLAFPAPDRCWKPDQTERTRRRQKSETVGFDGLACTPLSVPKRQSMGSSQVIITRSNQDSRDLARLMVSPLSGYRKVIVTA